MGQRGGTYSILKNLDRHASREETTTQGQPMPPFFVETKRKKSFLTRYCNRRGEEEVSKRKKKRSTKLDSSGDVIGKRFPPDGGREESKVTYPKIKGHETRKERIRAALKFEGEASQTTEEKALSTTGKSIGREETNNG